ncbi:peptide chain release factor N(5)-glutamine methyltransferase [Novosphingobium taihuense]|uniref:Release factor glutamine methyltransferase n=1 Tax=Novosphingobium taihuense TaxID=260085 RepID=A0A7W7ACG7_9SPHN|nr:peptide chain release factor N(5)-glutamine methyltransferase [Novosphingobium taihuense]MBB4614407.1 release factor glutamine methyltransferase [Novosphingobium taihuense]TWH86350.1 [protein release factor]-glutamine N5-methyltransferase [Novosphingobium taihuense]
MADCMGGGTIAAALRIATERLSATSDTARLDAELLMAHALGCSRTDLLLRHMQAEAPAAFAQLVERRLTHEPVAYITGTAEFYGLDLAVTPDVLIPRGDTETLVEAAREAFADRSPPRRILDLGTGSGALLLAALSLWPDAEGIGIERSPGALAVAKANGERHAPAARFLAGDWTISGWADDLGQFDLVLSNPPYVEDAAELAASVRAHEPASALFSGPEGLDDYRILIPQLPGLLAADGIAIVEIGWLQADAVSALAQAAGMSAGVHCDLASRKRAVEMARITNIPLGKGPAAY